MLSNKFCVISLVVFVYDYLLTFENEVTLVWKSWNKKSLVDVSYLVARYIPLPMLVLSVAYEPPVISPSGQGYTAALTTMILVGVTASQAIIFIRTYAIWPGEPITKRPVFVFLSSLFIASFITIPVTTCVFNNGLVGYSLAIVNESTILCMTLISYYRRRRCMQTESELVAILFRDCIVYFTCILVTSILNLVLGSQFEETSDNTGIVGLPQLQLSLHSILSTRVVLNLRGKRLEK